MKRIQLNQIHLSFKLFLKVFIFSITLSASFAQDLKSTYQVKKYTREIKKKSLIHDLRKIVNSGYPNRFVGTKGHKRVQSFLSSSLKVDSNEGKFLKQSFKIDPSYSKNYYQKNLSSTEDKWVLLKTNMLNTIDTLLNKMMNNFLWIKPGESNSALVVMAHYDTVSINKKSNKIEIKESMPGADYNASGVSVLLSIQKLLKPLETKKTIILAFLDAHSIAFSGAKYFKDSEVLKSYKIDGVINLEMLGHDSKFNDSLKKNGNMASYGRKNNKADTALYQLFEKSNKGHSTGVKFDYRANNFESSDHSVFNRESFGVLTFSQDWENDFNTLKYQTKNDFPETINQRTLYGAYRYIAMGILTYALNMKKIN